MGWLPPDWASSWYGATAAQGSLAFGVFVSAMTGGRWFGTGVLDRYGRVPALRISAATALVGLLVVIHGPAQLTLLAGTVLWGLGASLGGPAGQAGGGDMIENEAPAGSARTAMRPNGESKGAESTLPPAACARAAAASVSSTWK